MAGSCPAGIRYTEDDWSTQCRCFGAAFGVSVLLSVPTHPTPPHPSASSSQGFLLRPRVRAPPSHEPVTSQEGIAFSYEVPSKEGGGARWSRSPLGL